MDINSPINTQALLAANRLVENTLNLKVGQQLEAKVVNAYIQAAKNAITLTLGSNNITVLSSQPITLKPGQELNIQVTQIAPAIEFKILDPLPELKNPTAELRLNLIATARDGGSVAIGKEPMRPTARDGGSVAIGKEPMRPTAKDGGSVAVGRELMRPTSRDSGSNATGKEPMRPTAKDGVNVTLSRESTLPTVGEKQDSAASPSPAKQLLEAKIISITGNKIQLQVFTTDTSNKQLALIAIDRTQLTNAPQNLKVGQNLNLEIVKPGTSPEFKIIPTANNIPEAKVAEFIKQFLPRHEASPIFLNQLIKDLPQLIKNESVPQVLKDLAAKIIQNLPPKEQLISSQGLKQAIVNSGLFLEAKLSPAMTQTELTAALPQLIKNESVPQSLQRIAAEILQNLTPKELSLNSTRPHEQPIPNLKPATEIDSALSKLGSTDIADTDGSTSQAGVATQEAQADDFKAGLLKFIHALKQELTHKNEQHLNQVDFDLLKNLQNKSENTVAKIALDQLMSLPRDDNPKQQWIIDIPFMDRYQAESVRIEIQRDKENQRQSGNSDWSVNITITPPELGTIHCMVSFWNDVINTYFKSQDNQTTALIKQNLDYLKNQLEKSGLKTGHMDALDGAQTTQQTHQLAGKPLFDAKA